MTKKIRVVHYLNQFFAQIGGEEKADVGPAMKPGPVGPGRALQQALGDSGEVVATIYCGDNYFAEHQEQVIDELCRRITEYQPDLLVAGPVFESGYPGKTTCRPCTSTLAPRAGGSRRGPERARPAVTTILAPATDRSIEATDPSSSIMPVNNFSA